MGRRRNRKAVVTSCNENELCNQTEVACGPRPQRCFEIQENDIMGRCVSARENLEAGTILLDDEPLAVGPNQGCSPICIACYSTIDIASTARCQSCKWPLCKLNCEQLYQHNGHSKDECELLKKSKIIPTAEDHSFYNVLLPLRILLLKLKKDKRWEICESMESHNKFRENTEQWESDKKIIEFITKSLSLDVSDEEVHSICGYIQVNSFGVEGKAVSVLFPNVYLLSHDCMPNTSHVINKKYCIRLRSTILIKKGELLTLAYCNTLQGTLWRRIDLQGSKFFNCTCKRCADRTEFQTHMSTMKCDICRNGNILPKQPLDYNSDWLCDKCNNKQTWEDIYKTINNISDEAGKVSNEDIPEAERFLEKYKDKLHQKHFLIVSIKLKLSQMYGKLPGYIIHTMNEEQLKRKQKLCSDILEVFNEIEPGLSRIRGVTLYELHAPTLLLASLEYRRSNNKRKFQYDLRKVMNLLSEASHILSFEEPDSPEGLLGKAAAEALQQMKT